MLRNSSGVGWGGMITFLALAHMLDATQLVWGGWVGGDDNIPCTCTHVGWPLAGAFLRSLALQFPGLWSAT